MNWKERIIEVLKNKDWKSRKQIKVALGLDYSEDKNKCNCLGSYIIRLVRSGHVERAHAPDLLKFDKFDHVKYVYRWTGKRYKLPSHGLFVKKFQVPCFDESPESAHLQ